MNLEDSLSDNSGEDISYSQCLPLLHEDDLEDDDYRRDIVRMNPLKYMEDEDPDRMKCHPELQEEEEEVACDECGEEFRTCESLASHKARGHCLVAFLRKEEELRIASDMSDLLEQTVCLQTSYEVLPPQPYIYEADGRR